ncbi:Motile sperm domain-containing protein 2 [Mortierella alpina]|uniref:Motile sperm domain-containing protein 2 n=1 Tax=Mortierella alpina TaxID=64518 RepID=A0A9P6JBZ4_MORAP|nr:Motile sperm domain-containing protein 2 [Mortierella alpina]
MTTATAAAGAPTNPQAPPALLRISPQTFQFTASKVSSGLVSKLKIKNLLTSHVGYKFKTNAPLRYSVKPVLGVLAPGQSIEVFVRCESWVNPQDRFLLQSVALGEEESQGIDATTWKEIDRRRIIENFIQCSSSSTLVMREPQDDGGSLSSSSSNSSRTTASSTQSSGLSEKARSQRLHPDNHQDQQKRPTVAHVHAAGRKMSTSSSVSSNTSSPGSYPTLFTSSKGGAPSRSSNSSAPGLGHGLLSKPVGYLTTTMSNSKHFLRTMSQFLAARKYTKIQMFTVSVICLLLGLLLPLEKIFLWSSGASSGNTTSSNTQFRSGVIHRKPIFSSSTASSGILPVMVTTAQAGPVAVAKEADPTELPSLEEVVPDEAPRPEVWLQDEFVPAASVVEGAL